MKKEKHPHEVAKHSLKEEIELFDDQIEEGNAEDIKKLNKSNNRLQDKLMARVRHYQETGTFSKKAEKEHKDAGKKMTKQLNKMDEEEQLDELSPTTIKNYTWKSLISKKIATDAKGDLPQSDSYKPFHDKMRKKAERRSKGIDMAAKRLTEEEQISENINHDDYVFSTHPQSSLNEKGSPHHVITSKGKLRKLGVKAAGVGEYGPTVRVTVHNKKTGIKTHHHVYHSDTHGKKNDPVLSIRTLGVPNQHTDTHTKALSSYLSESVEQLNEVKYWETHLYTYAGALAAKKDGKHISDENLAATKAKAIKHGHKTHEITSVEKDPHAFVQKGKLVETTEQIDELDQEDFDALVENFDQLDELSKETLKDYIKKAGSSKELQTRFAKHHADAENETDTKSNVGKDMKAYHNRFKLRAQKKMFNRNEGQLQAIQKMNEDHAEASFDHYYADFLDHIDMLQKAIVEYRKYNNKEYWDIKNWSRQLEDMLDGIANATDRFYTHNQTTNKE
jgi:hypothetical protein